MGLENDFYRLEERVRATESKLQEAKVAMKASDFMKLEYEALRYKFDARRHLRVHNEQALREEFRRQREVLGVAIAMAVEEEHIKETGGVG